MLTIDGPFAALPWKNRQDAASTNGDFCDGRAVRWACRGESGLWRRGNAGGEQGMRMRMFQPPDTVG